MAASAVSPERHDTVALAWVKAPILDCLGQARQALERFASEPGDPAMLAFFVDNLHQVQGCLRMLELRGAAHLAEELELLGRAMADGQVSPRGDCLGALFRGLEQLPPYLERLRGSRHDEMRDVEDLAVRKGVRPRHLKHGHAHRRFGEMRDHDPVRRVLEHSGQPVADLDGGHRIVGALTAPADLAQLAPQLEQRWNVTDRRHPGDDLRSRHERLLAVVWTGIQDDYRPPGDARRHWAAALVAER